jgi:hypothetical protein
MCKSERKSTRDGHFFFEEGVVVQGTGCTENQQCICRISVRSGSDLVHARAIPFLYCFSEKLLPRPSDWLSNIDITGAKADAQCGGGGLFFSWLVPSPLLSGEAYETKNEEDLAEYCYVWAMWSPSGCASDVAVAHLLAYLDDAQRPCLQGSGC